MTPRVALTIAGSDSGGGSGIQADLACFSALGVHGTSAVTAVTAQNTRDIAGVHEVPPDFVARQIRHVCADLDVAAVKTGMLAGAETVAAVAEAVAGCGLDNLVIDPVLVSTSGTRLMSPGAVEVLRAELFPLALLVTPNLAEAAALLGGVVSTLQDMKAAARALHGGGPVGGHGRGPRWVLVKGGHLDGPAIDVLFDGDRFYDLVEERIDSPNLHGTGCVLSAAITAHLALGAGVVTAVQEAKAHVTGAIRHAVCVGGGPGPVNPAWNLRTGGA